jgi:hypothetical protein
MLGSIWQLFVLFCLAGSISCVSWSTLTATQLSALEPELFSDITIEQLASIPTQAFVGFNGTQLAAIPSTSIRGLSALQLQSFPKEACGGFSVQQFSQISASAISGFNVSCFRELSGGVVADISAEQLSAISGRICNVFWTGLMHNIPAEAFAGLTSECAGNLTNSAIFSITAERLSFMPAKVFTRFSPYQLSFIPGVAFSLINMDQLSAITPASCTIFESRHMTVMPAASAPGLTPECAVNLGFSAISGLSGVFLANMTVEVFSVLTKIQISSLSPSVASIREDQLAALNPQSCAGFVAHQTVFLPPSVARGISINCFSNFTNMACRGLTSEFIEAMDPVIGTALSAECLRDFGESSTCNGLTAQFVTNIRAEVFNDFTFDCVSQTRSDAFQFISPLQIQHLSVAAFRGFTSAVQYIPQDTLKEASVDQLANLPRGLGSMTVEQLSIIVSRYQQDIVLRWTESQLSGVSIGGFKQKIPHQVPLMIDWHSISFSTITWLQLALLRTDTHPDFSSSVIAQMPGSAAAGFRADQIQTLTPAAVAAFEVQHSQNFLQDVTAAFSADQLEALRDTTFGGMSLDGTIGIRPEVIPSITASQLQHMTIGQLSVMTCSQLISFTETQVSHFNAAQQEVLQQHSNSCEVVPAGDNETPSGKTPTATLPAYFPSAKIIMVLLICLTGVSLLIGLVVYLVGRRRNNNTNGTKEEPLIVKKYTYV